MSIVCMVTGQETFDEISSSYRRSSKVISLGQKSHYHINGEAYTYEAFEGDTGEVEMFRAYMAQDCPNAGTSMYSLATSETADGSNGQYSGGSVYICDEDSNVIGGMQINGRSLLTVYTPIVDLWRRFDGNSFEWNSDAHHDSRPCVDYSVQDSPTPDKSWLITTVWCNGAQTKVFMDEVDTTAANGLKPHYLSIRGSQSHYPNWRMHFAILRSGKSARNLNVKQLRYTSAGSRSDQSIGSVDDINNIGGDPEASFIALDSQGDTATFNYDPIDPEWISRHRVVAVYSANIATSGEGAEAPKVHNVLRADDGTIYHMDSGANTNIFTAPNSNKSVLHTNPHTGLPWKSSDLATFEYGLSVSGDVAVDPLSRLSFVGPDMSTSIIDDNPSNTWTATGDSHITTVNTHEGSPCLVLNSGAVTSDGFVAGSGNQSFTIEGYFNVDALSGTSQYLVDFRPSGTEGAYPAVFITDTSIALYLDSSVRLVATSGVLSGEWNHWALVHDNGTWKFIVNTVEVGSTYYSTTLASSTSADRPIIGASGLDGVSDQFVGRIDEFKVYNGVALYGG